MSRLESVIRRLEAQRDCIDAAARHLNRRNGYILELGLGNGRTYDHLRARFPNSEIFVFDRHVRSHPSSTPDDDHMFLGDFFETLPQAAARLGAKAILAHCDFGSGKDELDSEVARKLTEAIAPLLACDAMVLSDQRLNHDSWQQLPLPDGVAPGRYFMFRTSA